GERSQVIHLNGALNDCYLLVSQIFNTIDVAILWNKNQCAGIKVRIRKIYCFLALFSHSDGGCNDVDFVAVQIRDSVAGGDGDELYFAGIAEYGAGQFVCKVYIEALVFA